MSIFLDQIGRRFAVVAAFPSDDLKAANDYMIANPETGVLATANGLVHIASIYDKGQPVGYKKCCVCGGNAGRHVQPPNQDEGWGICRRCADDRIAKGASPAEMLNLYGTEGLHYEARPALFTVQTVQHPMASTDGGEVQSQPMFEVVSTTGRLAGRYLSRVVAERVRKALNGDQHQAPSNVSTVPELRWHVESTGRAFILEADGTTVCEILAPARRGDIARDLVHAQLSAVKLLAALERLLAGLVDADEEGLVEHAEQIVAARAAIAFAKGEGQ